MLVSAALYVLLNLGADVLYFLANPRLRGPHVSADLGRPAAQRWRDARRRYKAARQLARRPAAIAALVVVLGFIVVAVAAPRLAPFDPSAIDYRAVRKAPSAAHRLGTDEVGRDVLSRVLWGARASLLAGVIPVTIAVALSVPLGLFSGCVGGWSGRAYNAHQRRHALDPVPHRGHRAGRVSGPGPAATP